MARGKIVPTQDEAEPTKAGRIKRTCKSVTCSFSNYLNTCISLGSCLTLN